MAALDELRAEVAAQRDVMQSATTLIEGLATRLDEMIANGETSETALVELRDSLRADRQALADAVARHDDDPTNDPVPPDGDTVPGGEEPPAEPEPPAGEDTPPAP